MDDNNNFNAGDRQTLIELRVDMRYTKEAMDRLSNEHAASAIAFARDLKDARDQAVRENKETWAAIDDLRKFRWSVAGGIAVGNVVLAGVARMIFR